MEATISLISNLPDNSRVIIVGAYGGIGGALLRLLQADPRVEKIHAWSRHEPAVSERKVHHAHVDITDEATLIAAAESVDRVDLVIVASGLLHSSDGFGPEKSWRDLELERLSRSFAVNAIGPALVAKHVLGRMPREDRAVFAALSARVGSIDDNRIGGWYGYRASKAALNQFIKTLSIELQRVRPQAICVGVHPGTVDTALSQPFQSNVPGGRLFSAETAARHLLNVIDDLEQTDTGKVFAWDGQQVPF